MDTDKIIQDLNRRFAAPLPEFYQRRIIFWYDEDKEFEDKLDEVVLENAEVIALTGNNAFSVKKLLSVDDLTTNYLVYSPCSHIIARMITGFWMWSFTVRSSGQT